MSFLTLQYGQCGNQVGESLYSTISEDIRNDETPYYNKSLTKWFNVLSNDKYEARSILIDTETKVINDRKKTPYACKNIIAGPYGGSANNWAFGYTVHSHIVTDLLLDKVRLEVEKCDYMLSFLNILSSSGGTGSGVGSGVIEELRNEYPNKLIVNAIVLPYLNGEIVTQNYNTVLSLAKLHDISDVELLFENEQIHELCVEKVYDSLNFSDLNKLIAFQLASIFQPIGDENNAIFLSHCTSHPLFKYLQIKSSYHNSKHPKFETNQCWRALLNSITRQTNYEKKLRSNSSVRMKEKKITSLVITRVTWTRKDKRDLLVALENYGPNNLTEIQKYLPEKSVLEIRHKIKEYKALARAQNSETSRTEELVLDEWIKLVKTSQSSQTIDHLYSRLFKYISLFGNHTTGTGVNIGECYFLISELMKGESLKKLDPYTADFLNECLTTLANKINQSDNTKMIAFIRNLKNLDHITANAVRSYGKMNTMSIINPLRVPEALLKLQKDEPGPSGVSATSNEMQMDIEQ